MRRDLTWRLVVTTVVLVVALGAWLPVATVNPAYDPYWAVGDSWSVRYGVTLYRQPRDARPSSTTVASQDVVYRYTVTSEGVEAGRNVVVLDVNSSRNGWPRWNLRFDRGRVVLLSVEEVAGGVPGRRLPNPFADDAWMADVNQFRGLIVHDFPRMPDVDVAQTRVVQPVLRTAGAFTQQTSFATDRATVVMTRPDPVSSMEHRTTIEWMAGRKWWTSAEIRVGDDVLVSGRLVEP